MSLVNSENFYFYRSNTACALLMKNFILLLLFILLLFGKSFGQPFYISATNPVNYSLGNVVVKVTKTDTGFVCAPITIPYGYQFFSIAMDKNGFYWLDGDQMLYEGTLSGNSLINCHVLTKAGIVSNALTIGSNGKLCYSGASLYTTDVNTLQTHNLGAMSYWPNGDLTFYKGDLYMASGGGLAKVDTVNTAATTPYLSTGNYIIYGLVTVSTGLHTNEIYGLAYVDGRRTDIIELDMENKVVKGVVGSIPYNVLDAASPVEDGGINGIHINGFNIHQDCSHPTNGIVEVITAASTNNLTYALSNGQSNTTGVFTNIVAGTYQLKVTSAVDEQDTTVTVPAFTLAKPAYSYSVNKQVCDAPGNVIFMTSTANNNCFVKLNGSAFSLNHTFMGLTSGTYRFFILNSGGCTVDSVDIAIPRDKCTIQVTGASVTKDCNEVNQGQITVTTAAHSQPYTYTLNGTSNTTGVFDMLAPANYKVGITSIEDTTSVSVTVPDFTLTNPVFTFTQTNPNCGDLGSITFNTTNSGQYRVQFGQAITPLTNKITGITAGINHFNILDAGGCLVGQFDVNFKQDKCTIKFNSIAVQQQCDAFNRGVVTVLTNAHQDAYSYALNGVTNTTGIFQNLAAGNYTATITSPTDTVNVAAIVPDYKLTGPAFTYTTVNPACAVKGSIAFNIANSNQYQIQYGASTYPLNHLFNNLDAGNYHFVVLTQTGCLVDQYDVTLQYQPCPVVIDSIVIKPECNILKKGVITVTCQPIPETYTYALSNGETNHTGVFNLLDPGSYQLTVSASGGAPAQIRTVIVPDYSLDKPSTVVNPTNPVCELRGQIRFTVDNNSGLYNIQFQGSVYPSTHVFTDLYADEYNFQILKKNGCIADAITVKLVQEACDPVSFPSAFTPNQDGVNDIFRADPQSKATAFHLQIFNRWGVLLFTSTNLQNGWDGSYKGKEVPVGTYYWIATFITQENKQSTLKGSVTLIR